MVLDYYLGRLPCLAERAGGRQAEKKPNLQQMGGQDKPYGSIAMWENCVGRACGLWTVEPRSFRENDRVEHADPRYIYTAPIDHGNLSSVPTAN
jgi:hypothetical protein